MLACAHGGGVLSQQLNTAAGQSRRHTTASAPHGSRALPSPASVNESRAACVFRAGGCFRPGRARCGGCARQHREIVAAAAAIGLGKSVSHTPGLASLPGSRRSPGCGSVAAVLVKRNPEILKTIVAVGKIIRVPRLLRDNVPVPALGGGLGRLGLWLLGKLRLGLLRAGRRV